MSCCFDIARLRASIKPLRLYWFPRLRSTNDHAALLRQRRELFAPALVLTGKQSRGRGRGRRQEETPEAPAGPVEETPVAEAEPVVETPAEAEPGVSHLARIATGCSAGARRSQRFGDGNVTIRAPGGVVSGLPSRRVRARPHLHADRGCG